MEEQSLQMIIQLIEEKKDAELISIISELKDYSQFAELIKAISQRMASG